MTFNIPIYLTNTGVLSHHIGNSLTCFGIVSVRIANIISKHKLKNDIVKALNNNILWPPIEGLQEFNFIKN